MVRVLCSHSAGYYYTVLDSTQIFNLVICNFTDIDEWGLCIWQLTLRNNITGNKYIVGQIRQQYTIYLAD